MICSRVTPAAIARADISPAQPFLEARILRPAAVVHEDHRAAALGGERGQLGVEAEAPDIVDDGGPGIERGARHLGLRGVDRDRQVGARDQALDHRHHAPDLLIGGDRRGAGARALAADIEDVRALGDLRHALLDGARDPIGTLDQPIAREGIGGHVEDAHDIGPRAPVEGLAQGKAHRGHAFSPPLGP
jgi:hypothetical protein